MANAVGSPCNTRQHSIYGGIMKKQKHTNKDLLRLPHGTWSPFQTTKRRYKIYKDGNHFVGTFAGHQKYSIGSRRPLSDEQRFFDEQYSLAIQQGMKANSLLHEMRSTIHAKYPCMEDTDNFVKENIKRKKHNFFSRLKRFRRKASLNLWNKFVTITYDDKKMDAETFRRKLRKCLSNLHARRGWRYMGVFEKGEDNGRLHFHAIMYIPQNQMIGEIVEKKDYSTKQHQIQVTHSNTFFEKTFGRNDFEDLKQEEIMFGNTLEYITKYLQKSGEKIVYSRGIPSEIYKEVDDKDIAVEMLDFGTKFVFFDDIIDVEIDVMRFKRRQSSIFDDLFSLTG